jgi:hypothetical protein
MQKWQKTKLLAKQNRTITSGATNEVVESTGVYGLSSGADGVEQWKMSGIKSGSLLDRDRELIRLRVRTVSRSKISYTVNVMKSIDYTYISPFFSTDMKSIDWT